MIKYLIGAKLQLARKLHPVKAAKEESSIQLFAEGYGTLAPSKPFAAVLTAIMKTQRSKAVCRRDLQNKGVAVLLNLNNWFPSLHV